MVRIRLRRMGSKHKPAYRVVIADARAPRDGKFIETIGHYNPQAQPKILFIKQERARYWLNVGAQPSDTVVRLLKNSGVLDGEGKVTTAPVATIEEAPAPTKKARIKSSPVPAAPVAPAASSIEAAPVVEAVPAPAASSIEAAPVVEAVPAVETTADPEVPQTDSTVQVVS